jgi:hypothetical protein
MAVPTLNSYADVQTLLNDFVASAGVTPGLAPHGIFWETLSYDEFTTGNVPGIHPPVQILVKGDAASSNIILALSGEGPLFGPGGRIGQMPRPDPPYDSASPSQADVITALSNWINANCPDNE